MAYPAQRLKLVAHGRIGTVQTWSTDIQGLVGLTAGSWGVDQLQAACNDFEPMFSAWALALHPMWSPQTTYEGLRAYYYESGGDRATLQAESAPAGPVQGTGGHGLPTQASLVASFRTERVGRSFRGRSYAPLTAAGIDLLGELNAPDTTTAANAYQTLLQALNAYTSGPSNVARLTIGVASAVASVITPITLVIVDSEPDVQRRRADKIAATTVVSRAI